MGFRLHKRLQLTKGLWINLSKIGGPLSFRRRELTTNIAEKGVRKSVGLSGSSLSYQPKLIKLGKPVTSVHVVTTLAILVIIWALMRALAAA